MVRISSVPLYVTAAPATHTLLLTRGPSVAMSGARKLTATPPAMFLEGHNYTVQVDAGAVVDVINSNPSGQLEFSFTTCDNTPPYVTDYDPTLGEIGVAVSSNVVLTFNEVKQTQGWI